VYIQYIQFGAAELQDCVWFKVSLNLHTSPQWSWFKHIYFITSICSTYTQ